ncbi:hypothetical protein BRD56_11765 [Thermoplasmatales archaeon SW_10_69_26]|nr:MAG: hypothetical protein BRD56_11765 [Thermoplasmatales archaeon SW_10_69_26]
MARGWLPAASTLAVRGLLVLAGALVVATGAYAVFHLAPASLDPEPGQTQAVTERVAYWTPEDGHQQILRPRTDHVRQDADGLELVRRLQGTHSPRGGQFQVDLGDRWRLAEEPAAYAAFPPTPVWEEPPETVHVGVPWQTEDGKRIGGFDDFQRLHETERDGLALVKYEAREPSQFLVDGDQVWFRTAVRTALVEPVTGTVVDYHDEETLWTAPLEGPDIVHEIQPPRENREKVWEATVEPTPASQQQRVEQAEQTREDHLEHVLALAVPALLAGELLMGAGITGRPKRWLSR